ncbi:MAG TPA: hypothetical protein VMB85_16340 [Bryobacteraceae bacterium]|nr:hypothetical protein [Bryobacteraceae bacterium]
MLVIDSDPRFAHFHPELREKLRRSEQDLVDRIKLSLAASCEGYAEDVISAVAPMFRALEEGIPAAVMVSLLEAWEFVHRALILRDNMTNHVNTARPN